MLLQFLPYHHEAVSWWQRIAVVADLALLWALWPPIARGETVSITWHDFRRVPVALTGAGSLFLILFVFAIATFPGERLHKNPLKVRFIPKDVMAGSLRLVSLHDFLKYDEMKVELDVVYGNALENGSHQENLRV